LPKNSNHRFVGEHSNDKRSWQNLQVKIVLEIQEMKHKLVQSSSFAVAFAERAAVEFYEV
jgi:hypothetical protein